MESEGLYVFLVENQIECNLSGQQKIMTSIQVDLMMT